MKVICVSAVKGGVGKTMISLNIARLLKARNYKVGLLDADFDNANFAQFTQIDGKVEADPVEGFTLYNWDGISVFSMSLIAGREKAVSMPAEQYWQFVSDIAHKSSWNVDYLIVDLPGGGGDVFKASVQVFADDLVGNLIVIQPSMWDAANRVLNLHQYFDVPVVGIIENMHALTCGHCGSSYAPFGIPIGDKLSAKFNVPNLGGIPLDLLMGEKLLSGTPWIEGSGLDTLNKAINRMEMMEKVRPGFLNKFKAKIMEGIREDMVKVIGYILKAINRNLPVSKIVQSTGFTEAQPVVFHILDETKTVELVTFAIRITGGEVKVLKKPYPQSGYEIYISYRTLARMIMGQKKTADGLRMCDPVDFWLNGDVYVKGEGQMPKAVHLFNNVFSNPEIMNEVRDKYGSTLGNWL
ncbi:MAG: P-loop NTPase [Dehalococcoidales bacterium]|nr:P-loop NTPase [Dehalococcoidales bacterium]